MASPGPDGSHTAGVSPDRGEPEEMRGDHARRPLIRLARVGIALTPEQKQDGQSGQREQAHDQEVGRKAPPALRDPNRPQA